MWGFRKTAGATQLVDLLARKPGHTASLAILDTTANAVAMSVRDNDAAAADGRTPPPTHGVCIPERRFRQRHLSQLEAWRQRERFPPDRERLAPRRLVEVGSDAPELCRVATSLLAIVTSSCPVERSFLLQSAFNHKCGIGMRTTLCVSRCLCIAISSFWSLTGQSVMTT
jgi:hypothetical protein